MAIEMQCPECGKVLRSSSSEPGKLVRCPGCKSPFRLPESDTPEAIAIQEDPVERAVGNALNRRKVRQAVEQAEWAETWKNRWQWAMIGTFVVCCLAVVGAFLPKPEPRPKKPDPAPSAQHSTKEEKPEKPDGGRTLPKVKLPTLASVKMAHYEQVATGMTYADVVKIVGKEGKEQARSEVEDFTITIFSWANWDGSNMTVIFQNGAVQSKTQLGLK